MFAAVFIATQWLIYVVICWQQLLQQSFPIGNGTEFLPSLSCKDIFNVKKALNETFQPGIYFLFSNTSQSTYRAFCREDGATLVLTLRSQSKQFEFNSSMWYNDSLLLNQNSFFENVESKYLSYHSVPLNSISIRFQATIPIARNLIGNLTIPVNPIPSLAAILGTKEYIPFNLSTTTIHSREKWAQLLPQDYAFQLGCNREGFNVQAGLGGGLNLPIFSKIGFYANENSPTDCSTCNSGFVIGSTYPSIEVFTNTTHYHGQFSAGTFQCPYNAVQTEEYSCDTIGGIISIFVNEDYDCSGLNYCNGGGRCVANNTCKCTAGVSGEACNIIPISSPTIVPISSPNPQISVALPIPQIPITPNPISVDPQTATALAIFIPIAIVILLLCCVFVLVFVIVIAVVLVRAKRKQSLRRSVPN